MIKYRLIHDKECLCDNLSELEAQDLLMLYREQHPDWKIETQQYNYAFGITHRWRDPDLY